MKRSVTGKAMFAGALALVLAGAGCQYADRDQAEVEDPRRRAAGLDSSGGVFGPGGLELLGASREELAAGGVIGVNGFLWRAALDTVSFMPLSSADPFGGVIITEWYAPPETPDERFKLTVYILDRALRADGLRVSVFRQERGEDGRWAERTVSPDTEASLENGILERARQMRAERAGG